MVAEWLMTALWDGQNMVGWQALLLFFLLFLKLGYIFFFFQRQKKIIVMVLKNPGMIVLECMIIGWLGVFTITCLCR